MHGTLSPEIAERLRPLREESDLYFDGGDCIKTGNLGVPLKQEPVWDRLRELHCTASVLGNRETHIRESAFRKKIQGAAHPILCANMKRKDGTYPLSRFLEIERHGVRVGVIGVMVPMVTAKMKTQVASVYLWDPPIAVAKDLAVELRPRVDLLIGLTHIGQKQDFRLIEQCPLFDVVFGGHSHTILQEPIRVGNTFLCQGGSHNRFAGVYEWSHEHGLKGGLREIGRAI